MNISPRLPMPLILGSVLLLLVYIGFAVSQSGTDTDDATGDDTVLNTTVTAPNQQSACSDGFSPLPAPGALESPFVFDNGLEGELSISAPSVGIFNEGIPVWKRESINLGGGTGARKVYSISNLPASTIPYSFTVGNLNPEEVQAIKFYLGDERVYPSYTITGAIDPTYDPESGEFLSDATDKLDQANITFDLEGVVFDQIVVASIGSYDYTYNSFGIPCVE